MGVLYKKFYDVSRVVLWGEAPDDDSGKRPRFIFSFRDGNPRFVVQTGVPGIEGMITFPADFPTMTGVLNLIKEVANGPAGEKFAVESIGNVYVDNKPTKDKRVASTLYIGKSKEGIVYLSIITENKPKIIFSIKSSPYHRFLNGNKEVLDEGKVSTLMTNGIVDGMLNIISDIIVNYSNEEYAESGRKQAELTSNTYGSNGEATSPSSKPASKGKVNTEDFEDFAL